MQEQNSKLRVQGNNIIDRIHKWQPINDSFVHVLID